MTPDTVESLRSFAASTAAAAQTIEQLGVALAGARHEELLAEERAVLAVVTTQLEDFERALAAVRAGFARLLMEPSGRED